MKLSPEVLVYVQTIKKYFKSNKEVRDYFLQNYDEEIFFKKLTEISQKNYEDSGEATLTKTQFEFLRYDVASDLDFENKTEEYFMNKKLFFLVPNFGFFSLN